VDIVMGLKLDLSKIILLFSIRCLTAKSVVQQFNMWIQYFKFNLKYIIFYGAKIVQDSLQHVGR